MKLLLVFGLLVACGTERNAATCLETLCPDPARPFCDIDGSLSGEPNSCVSVDCMPGQFESCRGEDKAITCNKQGTNFDIVACEFGCSDASGGCNSCNTSQCEKHIVPRYFPAVCNQTTMQGDFVGSTDIEIDTSNDLNCEQVVAQSSGPEICVLHYRNVTIQPNKVLRVFGPRAFALISDYTFVVDGVIDVSANGGLSGPGGGFTKSGAAATVGSGFGSGGAGARNAGGSGADATTAGAAANGGVAEAHPSEFTRLVGGATPNGTMFSQPGGGGGAVTLISCRGTVAVSGTIDAGGGGGDGETPGGAKRSQADGGGAGGTVVIQGMNVVITGGAFANGGGGGGAGALVDGLKGEDGQRSIQRASGGVGQSGAGDGGFGGTVNAPQNGQPTRGGGGGSGGFLLVHTPLDAMTDITPLAASPLVELLKTLATN